MEKYLQDPNGKPSSKRFTGILAIVTGLVLDSIAVVVGLIKGWAAAEIVLVMSPVFTYATAVFIAQAASKT